MISDNGSKLHLQPFGRYLVMDAMYFAACKAHIEIIVFADFLDEIRKKVFVYTDIPCSYCQLGDDGIFCIEWIKDASDDDVKLAKDQCFCSDCGMLIFVAADLVEEVLSRLDFDRLTESLVLGINFEYWNSFVATFADKSVALVFAPGMDSGFDFQGSGQYCLEPSHSLAQSR